MEQRKPPVFTLIHGTWGKNADFLRPESTLQQTIREQFSNATFENFTWSGWNSHSARIVAAKKLVVHLQNVIEKYPDADHYFVAHSHGGNIALYARRQFSPPELKGIVCVGTPFLEVSVQIVAMGIVIFLVMRLALILIALCLLFGVFEARDFFELSGGVTTLIGATFLAAFCFTWKIVTKRTFKATTTLLSKLTLLAKTFATDTEPDAPVFCVSARGDEPKTLLGLLDWITQIPLFADSVLFLTFAHRFCHS